MLALPNLGIFCWLMMTRPHRLPCRTSARAEKVSLGGRGKERKFDQGLASAAKTRIRKFLSKYRSIFNAVSACTLAQGKYGFIRQQAKDLLGLSLVLS